MHNEVQCYNGTWKKFFCAPELTVFCHQSQKTCFSNSPFDNFDSVLRCYFVRVVSQVNRPLVKPALHWSTKYCCYTLHKICDNLGFPWPVFSRILTYFMQWQILILWRLGREKEKDGTILRIERLQLQKQPPEVLYKKGVLRNFQKFTGKHLYQSLFFNKVVGLRSATLLETRPWHRCFPVNFAKFLRTPFLQNTSRQLLLNFGALLEIHFFKKI